MGDPTKAKYLFDELVDRIIQPDGLNPIRAKYRIDELIDDQMLDRIVAAPGPRRKPEKLDREALRGDLLNCYILYSSETSGLTAFKDDRERIISIQKHVRKLVSLMEGAADNGMVRKMSETWIPELKELLKVLDTARLQKTSRDVSNQVRTQLRLGGSPLQALVGLWLPEVYERHFPMSAGRNRAGRSRGAASKPFGPYIDFAHEVVERGWGIKCSSETIAKALTGRRGMSR